jgi:hypothetical protein
MMSPPPYFEAIRKAAAKRWEQLDADPELAAPWHLLFKQVQSPRHVLSELLQNADDAGATQTSVRVEDGVFIFEHNGHDFVEEHFASLCRFGYSNKRTLHTIGFRGIGFKSTFSLGDTVELYTPTLSVCFERQRFTEPRWIPTQRAGRTTQVRVRISDRHREQEISKNLADWLQSPLSLLFFKHIRKMEIGPDELHWDSLYPGPASQSEWMALNGDVAQSYLLAHSDADPFPEDCLMEIRQERQVSEEQLSQFPPCRVDIILGAPGHLFVVLPTGVETSLPFASNAPFIQDPSRLKIKDPEISPTNRWLMERIGRLAAAVMLEWLGQTQQPLDERSRAYGLFTDVDRNDNSLEGTCATTVEESLDAGIEGQAILLTDAGELVAPKEAIIIPDELLEVWTAEQVAAFLGDGSGQAPFSHCVASRDREKLIHWGLIEQISKDKVLSSIQLKHLPKPSSWRRLLNLWSYIAPDVTVYNWRLDKKALRIIPVQGKDVLYGASEVVRLAEKRLLHSDEDWNFIAEHLLVLNQNWTRFLADQRRTAETSGDDVAAKEVSAAFGVLNAIGLNDTSDVGAVVDQVASALFAKESVLVQDCVKLAQIAAKLNANTGASFRFVTRDLQLRHADKGVLWDDDGTLEMLLPESWGSAHLLHSDYVFFNSCTGEEWTRWLGAGRSGVLRFVPLLEKRSTVWSRANIIALLERKGFHNTPSYPYGTNHFVLEDWDFEEVIWSCWQDLAKEDPQVWVKIVGLLLEQPDSFWTKAKTAIAYQVARNRSMRGMAHGHLVPSWAARLRELPCLPDTRGFNHKPEELLLRAPETEPLLDVELFLHARLDREASRPLLKLLGVRDTPIGPGRLLDCLRALATTEKPPIHEVEKWYRRLDQLVDTCSTEDLASIKSAFNDENIVLTENLVWTTAKGAFLCTGDDEVPGAEIVRRSVEDLALWGKVGVADRPTIELAIAWLKQIPSGETLSQNDLRRVKAVCARHAVRVWNECEHWLNLAGEWVHVASISYSLSMQSLIRWGHLHEWVKQRTADFQQLPVDITQVAPFANIPSLASRIEERFHGSPSPSGAVVRQEWLTQLGVELQRIQVDDENETANVRRLGRDLAQALWQVTDDFELIPYIDGMPAGTPHTADVLWRDGRLYVKNRPHAKLARAVSQEVGRAFRRADIADAVKMCFDRTPEFVTDYMEENFTLAPSGETGNAQADDEFLDVTADDADRQSTTERAMDNGSEEAYHTTSDETPEETAGSDADVLEDVVAPTSDQAPPAKAHRDRLPGKHPKLSIIERFARANGFQKDGEHRFFHPDGSWIVKQQGERFWERRTAKGDLIRYYWPKDHCLKCEPLQLEADIWGLLDKNPATYSLVLSDENDRAIEMTGACLRAMSSDGEIKLYPATYRLVYQDGNE